MTIECMESEHDGPTLLYSGDVARAFRAIDGDEYKRARREFIRLSGFDFRRIADRNLRGYMRCLFEEWFAYDRPVDGMGSTTPFDVVARSLYEGDAAVGEPQYADFLDFSDTNFAAWFWIRDANASTKSMMLENLADGGTYEVADPEYAARFDGATGGSLMVRIARVRGEWRMVGHPEVVMREPADEDFRCCLTDMLGQWRPGFPELVGMLFSPHPAMADRDGRRLGPGFTLEPERRSGGGDGGDGDAGGFVRGGRGGGRGGRGGRPDSGRGRSGRDGRSGRGDGGNERRGRRGRRWQEAPER